MRKPIVAGNWKMNETIREAQELATGLAKEIGHLTNIDMVLCPPYTALFAVREAIHGTNIKLGAQDVFWEPVNGEFTGEISPAMLVDAGCQYVIIGHSERRGTKYEPTTPAYRLFQEKNESVNLKVKSALNSGLVPIVCVGETLEERNQGITEKVVADHVLNGLLGLTPEELKKTVIAYEPVWAIGKGKTPATPQQAAEVHQFIRALLNTQFGAEVAASIRIQYGGSLNEKNVADLLPIPDIDGGLVGGASLKVDAFSFLVKKAAEIKNYC
ncbi:MAG: triose-phosphate isomerase [bacterium]|nr:triose-phosphate isomerase [bacterium]